MTVTYVRKLSDIGEKIGLGEDPRQTLIDACGEANIAAFHPGNNMVLVATYVRASSKKITRNDGSIAEFHIGGDKTRAEDRFQSPVGLVLKLGPGCFENKHFYGFKAEVGDWIFYKVSDAHELFFVDEKTGLDGTSVRLIVDDLVFGIVDDPKRVY